MLARLASLLRNLGRKERVERDLEEEVDAYLEALTREKTAAGLSPPAARRAAQLELGGAEQVKEQVRQVRAGALLEQFGQDLRYGLRTLRKSPGFTVVAALTLAFGIGVSTAIFSIVDGVLLRPLPFREPERLVLVYEGDESGRAVVAWTEYEAYARQTRRLAGLAAIQPVTATVLGEQQPEQLSGALVSASLFPLLGVPPLVGRNFLPDEDRAGGGQVVALSESLWRRRYGADAAIVGRTLALDVNEAWGRPVERAQSYTVVGVFPDAFGALLRGVRGDLWLPLAAAPGASHDLFLVGRLQPGATGLEVDQELETIGAPLHAALHTDGRPMQVQVVPLLEDLLGDWRRGLMMLLGAVGFVLLIACVNVAGLFLARGCARERELGIRAALGAGRRRLIRQLLTETLLLSLAGGALAVLVASWSLRLLTRLAPDDIPRIGAVAFDVRAFGFMAAVVLLAAVASGLVPALKLSNTSLHPALQQGGRGGTGRATTRLRGLLVVAEVALAIVLLIGGGLMARSVAGLLRVDPGFDPSHVLTLRVTLPRHAYATDGERAGFYDRLLPQLRALAGVQSVGTNHAFPFGGLSTGTQVSLPGSDEPVVAQWRLVSPDYFKTLRIPLERGRVFADADMGAGTTAIVDRLLAQRLWNDRDPLGQQLVLRGHPPVTVVGVAGTILDSGLSSSGQPTVYLPSYPRSGTLAIRTEAPPAVLAAAVQRLISSIDPLVAPADVRTLEERVGRSFALQRFSAVLLGVFASAALFLGLVGLYGVISFSVNQQAREFGIRLALGARRGDVLRLVLGRGMKLVLIGVGAGLAGALLLTRLLTGMLFGVKPIDPLTYAAVPLTLALVALLACYLPARRAAAVDPVETLRHD
ncbi:MAG TPA: ABC transporter permease [Candidatus Polarisedimenticolaceae bacterium]|nr:ABC transporter permease [Candidatus Polarisedimenticolaceae bacterium]